MSYLDFNKLVRELCVLSKDPVPCYSVINDMFLTIDARKDQVIDSQEWDSAFGGLLQMGPKVSVKATDLTYWESSA